MRTTMPVRTGELMRMRAPHEEPLPPKRPRNRIAWLVAIAVILGMIAAGSAVFAWRDSTIRDRDAALTTAVAQRDQALATVTSLTAKVGALGTKVGALQTKVERLNAELAATTAAGRREVARLEALLGPQLADGKYFGAFYAVGATQDPPRLLIDLEQFFRGDAANQAAQEDGVLPPGESIPNDVYIRNVSPRWRMVEVDPGTKVALTTYPFGQIDAPQVVTFARFGAMYNSGNDRFQILHWSPYWIRVHDGRVVSIHQQYMP